MKDGTAAGKKTPASRAKKQASTTTPTLDELDAKPKRGGARPGSGRPKGTVNKRSQAIAEKIIADPDKTTPLEVMINSMLYYYELSNRYELEASRIADKSRVPSSLALAREHRDRAVEIARLAAPYMHPKLQAIEWKGTGNDGALIIEHVQRTIVDPKPQ